MVVGTIRLKPLEKCEVYFIQIQVLQLGTCPEEL